ncbi:MAG TPA: CHRD domain-containing protein [Edaphobacter sp.]|nr:CHRD domain-containing protein [Edaphobacter sp.]
MRILPTAVAILALGLSGNLFATTITYTAILNGPSEAPPNSSPGTGSGTVIYDSTANTLSIDVDFTGLTGTTTASHIHCCTAAPFTGTAGVATQTPTFVDFPLGVTSGTYSRLFDLSDPATYNAAFIAANGGTVSSAEPVLLAGLAANESYLNIHTTLFPAGEIRGFLTPVPEPQGLGLVGLLAGGAVQLWRKRSAARA